MKETNIVSPHAFVIYPPHHRLRWCRRPESEDPGLPWLVLVDLARALELPNSYALMGRSNPLLPSVDVPSSYADLPTLSTRSGDPTNRRMTHISLPFALLMLKLRGDKAAQLGFWLREHVLEFGMAPDLLPTPNDLNLQASRARHGLWWTEFNGITVLRYEDRFYMRLSTLIRDLDLGNGYTRSLSFSRCAEQLRNSKNMLEFRDPATHAKRAALFITWPAVRLLVERLRNNPMKVALYRRGRDVESFACGCLNLPLRDEFQSNADLDSGAEWENPFPAWIDENGISQEKWG